MKTISIALFTLSIIIGISTSAKMTPKGEVPDLLALFIVSLLLGIGSLVFWHKAVRREAKAMVSEEHSDQNPLSILKELFEQMKGLKSAGIAQEGYCDQLDQLSEGPIFRFHENSDILKELLGQEKAAEIILGLALSERMINRSWSAFSDGYNEEAVKSFDVAYQNLEAIVAQV